MTGRRPSAKDKPVAAWPKPRKTSAEKKCAKLQAQAALEEARHAQLCQLLEHTVHHHCDEYLRQLAISSVQVRTLAEIATMQSQLLALSGTTASAKTTAKPKAAKPESKAETMYLQLQDAALRSFRGLRR
ncbi:hypothetical protein ALO52_200097 [Pseudomonas syringae pv. primulae]|uniref:Uncharacterized protein n=1 Tax=Pseudomonas syringae pv. primulae TaxID=251707 RepID=A0A0Q0CX99_9PSED|nr:MULTISPECIES: hypothetical protein [Pseudomonas syringae group]KPY31481.1 hypothetical protein ALO52_200097 [Pseudomonas syringae pv. primulae]MBD8185604.1 hypothetical protein [Pseudomonas viridiflava]